MFLFTALSLRAIYYGMHASDNKPWYDHTKASAVSNML